MIHKGHPLCGIIINIKDFDDPDKLKKREGSDEDVKKMTELLNMYGVDLSKAKNVTAAGMEEALTNLKEWELSTYSGLIVTIMTHGGPGNTLYGRDGKKIQLKKLAQIFNSAECKDLKGKPKIFIINACRGHKENVAERDSDHDQIPQSSLDNSK